MGATHSSRFLGANGGEKGLFEVAALSFPPSDDFLVAIEPCDPFEATGLLLTGGVALASFESSL